VSQAPGIPKTAGRPSPVHRSHREGLDGRVAHFSLLHHSFRVTDNHPVTAAMPTKVVLSRQRWENTMAFGIRSNFASTSARPAWLVIALGAWLGPVWRQLHRCVARRESKTVAELDEWLLRDIGVTRERDIGLTREVAEREARGPFWRP
jgi:uncharacterized protein YjiS (DUF1127 family)